MFMVIKLKKVIFLIISLILLTGCGKRTENPIVTMEISDYGTIKIELYPKYAPNTIANFVNLVESGFYNDNTFHRLVPGFVLQGGDQDGDGTGGPGYTIKGEFSENGYVKNTLKHDKGVVSMARTNMPNSAGSQFFIVLDDTETVHASLDNKYAAFGKVIEGMDIIENIEKNATVKDNQSGKLKKNIAIKNATVNTFGKEYSVKKIQENN